MSRRSQIAFGAGLAIALLWLFLREADLGVVLSELRRADYRWVALSVVLTLLLTVHRGWRWHYLLLPIKDIRLGPLVSCTFMGWAFTTLLPGRLGEVAKPVLLGRREGISKTAAFAAVVLERLFDLFVILLILAVYVLAFPLPSALDGEGAAVLTALRASGFVALAALAVAIAFMVVAQVWPEQADAALARLLGFVPGRFGEPEIRLGPKTAHLVAKSVDRDPRIDPDLFGVTAQKSNHIGGPGEVVEPPFLDRQQMGITDAQRARDILQAAADLLACIAQLRADPLIGVVATRLIVVDHDLVGHRHRSPLSRRTEPAASTQLGAIRSLRKYRMQNSQYPETDPPVNIKPIHEINP